MVTQHIIDLAQPVLHLVSKGHISEAIGNGQGALAERHGSVILTHDPAIVDQIGQDLSQAYLIVQPFGESLGLMAAVTNAPELSPGIERVSKREARSIACSCVSRRSGSWGRICRACS